MGLALMMIPDKCLVFLPIDLDACLKRLHVPCDDGIPELQDQVHMSYVVAPLPERVIDRGPSADGPFDRHWDAWAGAEGPILIRKINDSRLGRRGVSEGAKEGRILLQGLILPPGPSPALGGGHREPADWGRFGGWADVDPLKPPCRNLPDKGYEAVICHRRLLPEIRYGYSSMIHIMYLDSYCFSRSEMAVLRDDVVNRQKYIK